MKNSPIVKKKWMVPEIIIIATNEVENKDNNTYQEKTLINSYQGQPSAGFNRLVFQKSPGGGIAIVGTVKTFTS